MNKTITLFVVIIGILFSSCSIQHRHYMKGYNVQMNTISKTNKSIADVQNQEKTYSASLEKENSPLIINPVLLLSNNDEPQLVTDSCDLIKLNNGKLIYAKITEVSPTEIHYRICDVKGIWKKEMIISKDKVASIKYSNGTLETISMPKEVAHEGPVKDYCFDIIKMKQKSIYATVTEINNTSIVFDTWSNNGQVTKSSLKKIQVSEIDFCGGTKVNNIALRRAGTFISDRKEMKDSLFWKKYQYAIIATTKRIGEKKKTFKGFVSEIAADTIKFIPFDDTNNQEVKIRSKKIKKIVLYNRESFSNFEIKKLKKKITSTAEVEKYAKSAERKELLVKALVNKSCLLGIASIVPLISIPFDIFAIKDSKKASEIIKSNPEFKKYKAKATLGFALGIFGLVLSLPAAVLLVFLCLLLIVYLIGLALGL